MCSNEVKASTWLGFQSPRVSRSHLEKTSLSDMARYNDSTGKHKVADARSRSAVLSTVFVLGVTLGIVLSEKLYIRTQEGSIPVDVLKTLHLQRLGSNTTKEVVAVASGDKQADTAIEPHYVKAGEPRNELEKILQSVAPDREVMIVISNMNLVRESSLELWLQVRLAAFWRC